MNVKNQILILIKMQTLVTSLRYVYLNIYPLLQRVYSRLNLAVFSLLFFHVVMRNTHKLFKMQLGVAALKCLPVHRYSVIIFTFSGPLGLYDSTILFQNRVALNPALGGLRDVASAIISH